MMACLAALFASHTGVVFPDPSDPMEIAASRGLLSPYLPSILGQHPHTSPYPISHTMIGILVRIRKLLRHWHAVLACTRTGAPSVLKTGRGSLAHTTAVTPTPLGGVESFTTTQPNVNLICQEEPYSDSTTNYYSGLTSPNYIPFPLANIPPNTTSTNYY
jgi:hypothetical protein